MDASVSIRLSDASQVGEARRVASGMAQRAGFTEEGVGKVALVVTEAARNVVLHAKQGELLLRTLNESGRAGLELLALDKGPGMESVARCLEDGYSTAGTKGVGLGAIQRISHQLDVHSVPGRGTALLARLWARPEEGPAPRFALGLVNVPILGEQVCGDSWAVEEGPPLRARFLVVDGLGHGPGAATAARAAVGVFASGSALPLTEVLQAAHRALRSTRGAAMAIAEVDGDAGTVRFAGAGNVFGCVTDGETRHNFVSMSGTVGHELRTLQEFVHPWWPGATLLMCSDGISTHWRLEDYPALLARDPALVAGVLYRDHVRGRDDATVLVARLARGKR